VSGFGPLRLLVNVRFVQRSAFGRRARLGSRQDGMHRPARAD
jgi:hypothetical protein